MNAVAQAPLDHCEWLDLPEAGVSCAAVPVRPNYYPPPTHFRKELKQASGIYRTLCRATAQMFGDVRVGRGLDPQVFATPLADMVASVIRNPEAMVWLRMMHPPTVPYLAAHSVRTAVLSAVVARQMGLAEPQLARAAAGGLLCQIGKTRLPTKLLDKVAPISDEELERLRTHVILARDILEASALLDPVIAEIVDNHLERFDGSGLPEGKAGDRIPMLARIVGMVEWYDAMTSVKPYTQRVMNTTESMDHLYQQRNVLFQDQLVEEFVRALGLYPNGTLVELSTGAIALVQAQNPGNRTQPLLLVVQGSKRRSLARYAELDLVEFNQKSDSVLTIKRALPPGECELDVKQVMSYACKPSWQRLLGLT